MLSIVLLISAALFAAGSAARLPPPPQMSDSPACVTANPCYNDPEPLGCFPINPSNDFCKDIYAPWSPQQITPHFYMYTPRAPSTAQFVDYFNLNATLHQVKNIDWSTPLIMIVHGFEGGPKTWLTDAKDAIMSNNYNLNVLLCYWQNGSMGSDVPGASDYPQAVANTRVMGAMMGLILGRIVNLFPQFDVTTSTVAGFSLGAHTSAFAANWIYSNQGIFLPFLFGIDPAGPWFEGYPPDTRMDPTDATYVQAFHTDGEPLANVPPGYGTHEPMGHVDFFMNDGTQQPGCTTAEDVAACSHERATFVFIDHFSLVSYPQCQQAHGFPGDSHDSTQWDQGQYFSTNQACKRFGVSYRTPGSCSGVYYHGTLNGHDSKANMKYFGSQYKLTFNFPQSGFFDPAGSIDVRFYYNGKEQNADATWTVTQTDTVAMEGTISTIYTAPCDSTSIAANAVPNQISLLFHAGAGSPTNVTVNSLTVTSVDGSKRSVKQPFVLQNARVSNPLTLS